MKCMTKYVALDVHQATTVASVRAAISGFLLVKFGNGHRLGVGFEREKSPQKSPDNASKPSHRRSIHYRTANIVHHARRLSQLDDPAVLERAPM
jgi:hypothetical protein